MELPPPKIKKRSWKRGGRYWQRRKKADSRRWNTIAPRHSRLVNIWTASHVVFLVHLHVLFSSPCGIRRPSTNLATYFFSILFSHYFGCDVPNRKRIYLVLGRVRFDLRKKRILARTNNKNKEPKKTTNALLAFEMNCGNKFQAAKVTFGAMRSEQQRQHQLRVQKLTSHGP